MIKLPTRHGRSTPPPGPPPLGQFPGSRLPAAIAKAAGLRDDQTVERKVVAKAVLIRPVQLRISLAERLAAYAPMPNEPTEAMAWEPTSAEVIP